MLQGPTLFKWYGFMERHIGAAGFQALIKKVCADQLLFAPSFIVVLLSTIGLSQGQTVPQVKDQLIETYPDVLISNYKVIFYQYQKFISSVLERFRRSALLSFVAVVASCAAFQFLLDSITVPSCCSSNCSYILEHISVLEN